MIGEALRREEKGNLTLSLRYGESIAVKIITEIITCVVILIDVYTRCTSLRIKFSHD